MSIMVHPASWTIDSAAIPDNASIAPSVRCWAVASAVSSYSAASGPSSGPDSASRASVRSTTPSTIQVSLDIWSRTARAARPRPSTDWASDPARVRSAVSDQSVYGADRTASSSVFPAVTSASASLSSALSSTGRHSLPSTSRRLRNSWYRSRATMSNLANASLRSA